MSNEFFLPKRIFFCNKINWFLNFTNFFLNYFFNITNNTHDAFSKFSFPRNKKLINPEVNSFLREECGETELKIQLISSLAN